MAINFECTECNNTLEVPDGSEGEKAKCPACSAIISVPHAQPHQSSPSPDANAPVNPYESTSRLQPHGPSSLAPSGELTVRQIDIGWTFTATWELFKVHFGILIGIFLIMMAASTLTSIVLFVLRMAVFIMTGMGQQPDFATPITIGFSIFSNAMMQLVNLWFTIASIRMLLQVSRNQPADFGLFLQSGPFMLRSFFATLLFAIMTLLGLLLFIVPGIYVMLTFWNYNYFIVDRNCGVMESFRLASVHAQGNRLSILVMFLITMGLSLLGMMAFCMGWIATVPFCMLILVISYLTMTGQPFVQPRLATNGQA